MAHPAPVQLQGPIEPGGLPRALSRIHRECRTGLLHLTRGQDRSSLCFVQGHLAWGHSTMAECQLGPVLLRHGLLSPEALDQVNELMGRGKRMGELLLELGSLDQQTLDEGLALHVREMLLAAFTWPDGAWRFEDLPPEFFRGYDQALGISTGDLILDAAWCVSDPDVVRYHLGDLDRRLALTVDPRLRLQQLTLGAADAALLAQVNGVRTAREAMAAMPAGAQEAQRSLFGLLCTGLLELLDPEEPEGPAPDEGPPAREEILALHAELAGRDHFEVLGLLHSATAADVDRASARLVRRYGGALQDDPLLAPLRPQVEAIVARVLEAARVLRDPRRRDAYERALALAEVRARILSSSPSPEPEVSAGPAPAPSPEADFLVPLDVVAEAEAEFGQGRYWDALQAVEVVLPQLQGQLRRRALLLRARIYARNAHWRREAEEQLKEIVAADPANSEAFFLLGELYDEAGLAGRAAAMFRKVLALKPRHAGALARLAGGG
jgi:curved DNA-binding protein CbpA